MKLKIYKKENFMKLFMMLAAFMLTFHFNAQATNAPLRCTIQAYDGHYLTAVGGGGRTYEAIHTNARMARSWESFVLIDTGEGSPIKYGIQTASGNFLTAVGGGGRTTDVIHSDAVQIRDWEKFTFNSLGFGWYSIQTINGRYLTAVNSGGLAIPDALHTDAVRVDRWEKFKVTCRPL
jgi:hypothetical protein